MRDVLEKVIPSDIDPVIMTNDLACASDNTVRIPSTALTNRYGNPPVANPLTLQYANLYAMLGNGDTMTWLTPHAAIMSVDGSGMLYLRQLNECRFLFSVDGKKIVARARSSEALWKIVGVVLRLVSARVVHSVLLEKCDCLGAEKVSTPPLWRI
jgi:hypothetical protein